MVKTPKVPSCRTDRRRDARLTVTGEAVVKTLHGRDEFSGGIVDVSAGGMRFRVRPDALPQVGDLAAVDVSVIAPQGGGPARSLRLSGFAEVLRVERVPGLRAEMALRFVDPLRLCDAFETPIAADR